MSDNEKQQPTTIITDGGNVILNSTGPLHLGSGKQINITTPADSDKRKK